MARRGYGEADKVAALAALEANGGNLKRTARETGVPRSTLREWSEGRGLSDAAAAAVPEARGNLADELEGIAWQIVGILPGKLAAATAAQAGTVMGICIDKARLLRGEPTSISEDVTEARAALELKLVQLATRHGTDPVSAEPDGSGGAAASL